MPLLLKMGKTAPDTTAMTVRGEFGFAYTNHLFTTERAKLGWRVIARPDTPGIRSQIVTLTDSPARALHDLDNKDIVFPSREAFVGYWVPMDALLRAGLKVSASFASNQEGAIGQLRAGAAAAVNAQVLENYARRENFQYRVLWTSEAYHDLPIMANPSVPRDKVEAVRRAFVTMGDDPEGQKILETSAAVIKHTGAYRFVTADNGDYENYRRFYRRTLVRNE